MKFPIGQRKSRTYSIPYRKNIIGKSTNWFPMKKSVWGPNSEGSQKTLKFWPPCFSWKSWQGGSKFRNSADSNSEKDREASERCSWWLRSEEAVRQDERYLWSWESVGGCLREQSTARRCNIHVFLMHTTKYSTPFDEKWKTGYGSGGVSMTLRSLDTPSLPGLCVACIQPVTAPN